MKAAVFAVCIFAFVPLAWGGPVTGEGAFFFDRGHYWIEITFYDAKGKNILPAEPKTSHFEVVNFTEGGKPFKPSRIEVFRLDDKKAVLILSSGRFKGKGCYRVTYRPGDDVEMVIDSICDPFHFEPGVNECAGKRFFRRYVAPAFSRSGDIYSLNQFKYEYDMSAEKSRSNLLLRPCFETKGWGLEPYFEQDRTVYHIDRSGETDAGRRKFGVEISKSVWVRELRFSLSAGYDHERSLLSLADTDSTLYTQSLVVEWSVRLDNFFDSINRHCLSVFKGIDVGFGYAWYQSDDEEVWGETDFERTTPFLKARFTWTILYGFQLSYSVESYWPGSLEGEFEEFHSVRFRLLLRDVLARPSRKLYHPDLELAFDTGRRLPLFEEERKASLGFTFDLFPW
ncbi:MAG: hypothetical protein KAX38_01875 [Candidatus Krumholzibacteria bacterium]|nr:hypothetical protein [Candidatus Krumholzibacteria bacterium]